LSPDTPSPDEPRPASGGIAGVLVVPVVLLAGHYLGAALALAWTGLGRRPFAALGLVRPRSWPRTIAIGVVAGVALRLVLKRLVMPLLSGVPGHSPYGFLVGNTAALPGMIFDVVVGAGIGEEIVWRGFLFERLGAWLGSGRWARVAIVVIGAVLFGLAHLYEQGWAGAAQAVMTGLVLGTLYVRSRSLALPMIVHASYDLAAVLMIYAGIERVGGARP
jgi:membrane protease YdiL (CAAX protease family)